MGLACSQSKGIESVDAHVIQVTVTRQVEPADNNEIGKDQDGALEIITLSLAVDVRQEENAKNHGDHVPLGEDETVIEVSKEGLGNIVYIKDTHLNECLASSAGSIERVYRALNRTRAGTCNKQTCNAYAEPISMDRAMLPFIAKEIAF